MLCPPPLSVSPPSLLGRSASPVPCLFRLVLAAASPSPVLCFRPLAQAGGPFLREEEAQWTGGTGSCWFAACQAQKPAGVPSDIKAESGLSALDRSVPLGHSL